MRGVCTPGARRKSAQVRCDTSWVTCGGWAWEGPCAEAEAVRRAGGAGQVGDGVGDPAGQMRRADRRQNIQRHQGSTAQRNAATASKPARHAGWLGCWRVPAGDRALLPRSSLLLQGRRPASACRCSTASTQPGAKAASCHLPAHSSPMPHERGSAAGGVDSRVGTSGRQGAHAVPAVAGADIKDVNTAHARTWALPEAAACRPTQPGKGSQAGGALRLPAHHAVHPQALATGAPACLSARACVPWARPAAEPLVHPVGLVPAHPTHTRQDGRGCDAGTALVPGAAATWRHCAGAPESRPPSRITALRLAQG